MFHKAKMIHRMKFLLDLAVFLWRQDREIDIVPQRHIRGFVKDSPKVMKALSDPNKVKILILR